MMAGKSRKPIRLTPRHFSWLLASLIIVLVLAPQFEDSYIGAILLNAGLTAVFVTGVIANRHRKLLFRASLVIAVVAIPLTWAAFATHAIEVSLSQFAVVVLFCGFTAGLILSAVLREYLGGIQAVLGAICVYLLIGLAWATAYAAIDHIEPQSFDFNNHRTTTTTGGQTYTVFSQMVYFSFVTMSTLGYGDVTPRTSLAETATWMQSVVGQLYIAILIARLVTEIPRPGRPSGETESSSIATRSKEK
jgi:voltage-gated potassium channel